jgi:acetyltransferase-like isoleucine patch superfamily enzyme
VKRRYLMYEVGLDPHADLIRFLEDHDRLDTLPEPEIYEYVVFTKRHNITIGRGSRIDSFVKLEGGLGLSIGQFVHIASFAHLGIGGGTLRIGDFAAVASGGKIISGSNQVNALSMSACAPPSIQRVVPSVTTMCAYSCVLAGGIVLPGVTMGEGAVLAAGGVATRNIPEWEIWGGVPARFMSKRVVA